MADYDLSGLSPRSFERLIQALASKILGPGLVVFGDGPDGGREATFEGRVPYPSSNDLWDGYCVVQAKFLQRPSEPGKDGKWAVKQLRKELKGFDSTKGRRRPDYYIFATNVVLTPVGRKGGKDQIDSVFKSYRKKLSLRGWSVWDFDQIGTFLDTYSEIRRTYAAWITPGDVLFAVLEHLQPQAPDFLRVMTNYLAKELLADQYANLGQAGHSTDYKIPLARVFVDLPVTLERVAEPPREDLSDMYEKVTELISEIVERARDRFDPVSTRTKHASLFGELEPGRYVLVGGPGQGKTTVGQFACQLFRAALLQDRSAELPPEARQTLAALIGQCEEPEGPCLPRARRFPLRIVLSAFADALAANGAKGLSLLSYLAQNIEKVTSYAVSTSDLRNWLSLYPWFIVLDGLDEVPASTNREALLKAIQDFWVDAAQASADVLVLATTRPQGYNDDFSPTIYRHLWLAPLSPSRAMRYARKLAQNRWGHDSQHFEKIIAHLQKASEEEATARLMRSPLQVTIMATLVDQIGPPPRDRWRLFHDYYDVIYRREQERNLPTSDLLRNHKADVDAIHSQVGLVLQLESERAGGTEARMSKERFAAIVTARLEEEGQSGDALYTLQDEMIEAAANRLVFLVGLQEGQVGFEIRSLQEFMASEALMSGQDDKVQERLHRIAVLPTWRNVFVFAAGRCFAQDQHRRDTICTVCAALNTSQDPIVRETLAGSQLALELLENGVAHRQPKYARILLGYAFDLLRLPPSDLQIRLADIYENTFEEMFKQALERTLEREGFEALSAWACLLPLLDRPVPWSEDMARRHWPQRPETRVRILKSEAALRAGSWLFQRLEEWGHEMAPMDLSRIVQQLGRRYPGPVHGPVHGLFWRKYLAWPQKADCDVELAVGGAVVKARLPSLLDANKSLGGIGFTHNEGHPAWKPIMAAVKFSDTPSPETLAGALEAYEPTAIYDVWMFPWVYSACVISGSASQLAARVRRGDMGNLQDWAAAEERWRNVGLSIDDLRYLPADDQPFDDQISRIGFPFNMSGFIVGTITQPILDLYAQLGDRPRSQRWLASYILACQPNQLVKKLGPQIITEMLNLSGRSHLSYDWINFATLAARPKGWLGFLNTLGQKRRLIYMRQEFLQPRAIGILDREFKRDRQLTGILRLISLSLRVNPRTLQGFEIDAADFDDPDIRHAAIIVEVAQGQLTGARALDLATLTVELSHQRPEVVSDTLNIISRLDLFNDNVDIYLLKTLQLLGRDAWELRGSILSGLGDSLRRRRSDLSNPAIWRDLSLPERLLGPISGPSQ
jgi:hypothetical protein